MEETPQNPPSGMLTRREALKALAAATGAVVLANLPVSWKTPVVEVGVVPAHAQGGSGPAPVVNTLTGSWEYVNNGAPLPNPKAQPCTVTIRFNYQDTLGQVSGNSTVFGTYASIQNFSGFVASGFMNGNGYAGSIIFPFNSSTCSVNSSAVSVQLLVNGRYSNVTNGTVSPATT